MTAEQRLDRIEHITAGIAEERRKDREEYKTLWRDTQHQLNTLATETKLRLDQVAERIGELAEETRARTEKLAEADEKLNARVEALVSAIGQLITKQ